MNWTALEREIEVITSRASGAGGQHVNKVESRVTLRWSPQESQAVSEEERRRLLHHLKHRLDQRGVLQLSVASDRSQHANRRIAHQRLRRLVETNLRPIPPVRRAGSFKADAKKRRRWKERHSEKKANRRKDWR